MQKKRLGFLLLSIITALMLSFSAPMSQPVQAGTNYYIASNGSDSNLGTIDSPFATITHAVRQSVRGAGDIINVRGGTYKLKQTIWIGDERSGSANAHVIIRSYPGDTTKAILDGSELPSKSGCISINGDYIDIEGFECRSSKNTGIEVWCGEHVQILNNVIHDVLGMGILTGCDKPNSATDIRIDGNTVYHTNLLNQQRNQEGGWGMGITAIGASNITIVNNKVYENYGEGIGCPGSSNCVATNNIVYDNFSVEMYMSNTTDSVFERNLVYNTGNKEFFRKINGNWEPATGIQMGNEENPSMLLNNNRVSNNIVIGGYAGFFYGNYDLAKGMKNSQIVNNTFYKSTGPLLFISDDNNNFKITFANNIFFQDKGKAMTYLPSKSRLNAAQINFQHNLWYGGIGGDAAGTNDVNADPLLVNPGSTLAENYKLKSGSPAANVGLTIKAVTSDYFGAKRPISNYDIGAHEAS